MTNALQTINGQIVLDGLLIVGTHPECGKTIATTGLCGAMIENGFRRQAIKPLEFAPAGSLKQTLDQDFMNRVLRPMQRPENLIFESFYENTNIEWKRLIHNIRSMTYPCIIESPGSYASPLSFDLNPDKDNTLKDAVSLSKNLGTAILLVTEKSPQLLENMRAALSYLRSEESDLMGWISVETHQSSANSTPNWELESQYIVREGEVPYLGNIAYSPSIGITHGHQGNLIKQTQEGIDLLPIQMATGMLAP